MECFVKVPDYWKDYTKSLYELQQRSTFCDIALECRDGIINVHKLILITCGSLYIEQQISECSTGIRSFVSLNKYSSKTVCTFVCLLYTGQAKLLQEQANELRNICQFLGIEQFEVAIKKVFDKTENQYEEGQVSSQQVVLREAIENVDRTEKNGTQLKKEPDEVFLDRTHHGKSAETNIHEEIENANTCTAVQKEPDEVFVERSHHEENEAIKVKNYETKSTNTAVKIEPDDVSIDNTSYTQNTAMYVHEQTESTKTTVKKEPSQVTTDRSHYGQNATMNNHEDTESTDIYSLVQKLVIDGTHKRQDVTISMNRQNTGTSNIFKHIGPKTCKTFSAWQSKKEILGKHVSETSSNISDKSVKNNSHKLRSQCQDEEKILSKRERSAKKCFSKLKPSNSMIKSILHGEHTTVLNGNNKHLPLKPLGIKTTPGRIKKCKTDSHGQSSDISDIGIKPCMVSKRKADDICQSADIGDIGIEQSMVNRGKKCKTDNICQSSDISDIGIKSCMVTKHKADDICQSSDISDIGIKSCMVTKRKADDICQSSDISEIGIKSCMVTKHKADDICQSSDISDIGIKSCMVNKSKADSHGQSSDISDIGIEPSMVTRGRKRKTDNICQSSDISDIGIKSCMVNQRKADDICQTSDIGDIGIKPSMVTRGRKAETDNICQSSYFFDDSISVIGETKVYISYLCKVCRKSFISHKKQDDELVCDKCKPKMNDNNEKATSVSSIKKEVPVSTGSNYHNITLTERTKGRINWTCDDDITKKETVRSLGESFEDSLMKFIRSMSEYGYLFTDQELVDIANDYLIHLDQKDECEKVSFEWLQVFKKCWPDLLDIQEKSSEALTTSTIEKYLNDFTDSVKKHGLSKKHHLIYNIDEITMSLNINDETETVTVIACGSAAGLSIPPFFIFQGVRNFDFTECSIPGATGTLSNSGLSNSQIFSNYLKEHFIKHAPRVPGDKTLLLMDGDISHAILNLSDWAGENDIILQVFPAKTSEFLQPLEVVCHSIFRETILNVLHATPLNRNNLCAFFCIAYKKALSCSVLKEAFTKTGISTYVNIL